MSIKRNRHQATDCDIAFFGDLKKKCETRVSKEDDEMSKLCPPFTYPENADDLVNAVREFALTSFGSNLAPDDAYVGIHEHAELRLWKKHTLLAPLKSSEWWMNVFVPWFTTAFALLDATKSPHDWCILGGHIAEILEDFENWFRGEWEDRHEQVKMTFKNGKVQINI